MLSCLNRVWLFATNGLQLTRLLCPWDSPRKNTRVGAVPSSRGSSSLRNPTLTSGVSCTAGRFFTHWATWDAHFYTYLIMEYLNTWCILLHSREPQPAAMGHCALCVLPWPSSAVLLSMQWKVCWVKRAWPRALKPPTTNMVPRFPTPLAPDSF